MTTTWFDEEARSVDFVRKGADIVVAGIRRPWLTLLGTLLFTAAVWAYLEFGRGSYAPRLVLRLVEGSGNPSTMPHMKRRLGEYVREGIFTSQPLFEVMQKHALYPTLSRKNPRAALDSFREDIDVDVYQNYFVEPRSTGDGPRTARVAVSYQARDRATALAVTRDLGALIARHEARVRREQAERAAVEADRTRDALQVVLQRRVEEVASREKEVVEAATPDPERHVELIGLWGSLAKLERELDEATRRAAVYELGAALEHGGVGLRFEIADEASLPSVAGATRWMWATVIAAFVVGMPLSAATVGAFVPRRRA